MNYLLAILAVLLISTTSFAQTGTVSDSTGKLTPVQTAALNQAADLNVRLVELFQQQQFNEALKVAGKIQALIETNGLSEEATGLTLLANVGEILLVKGKESDAIALFQKVLDVYQRKLGENSVPAAEITNRITQAYFRKEDYEKAQAYTLKLVPMWERISGTDSAKVADTYDFLGNVYLRRRMMGLAEAAYLKAIAINDRLIKPGEENKRSDLEHYRCFIYHRGYLQNSLAEATNRITEFERARAAGRPEPKKLIDVGVVNSRALELAVPKYPTQAGRARGFVIVEVTIDETGKVIDARSTCGINNFLDVSEYAARRSKFSPTLIGGVPVKIKGTIAYKFLGRN